MRTVTIIIACLIVVSMTGCGLFSPPEAKTSSSPAVAPPSSTNHVATATKATTDPPKTETKGIKINRLDRLVVEAGDRDGTFLGDFFSATHLCNNTEIDSVILSYPKWGSLKTYPDGHRRYYPPTRPCTDQIDIQFEANDGCTKSDVLYIDVTDSSGNKVASSPRPASVATQSGNQKSDLAKRATTAWIAIDYPANGFHNKGRVLNLEGKAYGLEGKSLEVVVIDPNGGNWIQDAKPMVLNNGWSGWVYLGDEYGHGIGDRFTIIVSTTDGKHRARVWVIRDS